jgi:hypothetical protein
MRSGTKTLLLALFVMVGSSLSASALTIVQPSHVWTFQAGGRTFGFTGYSPPSYPLSFTVVHYGFGTFKVRWPVHGVAALTIALPLLVGVGGLFIVRRRHDRTTA